MKASQETGSDTNIGFRQALLPSYLRMLPAETAFISFSDAAIQFICYTGNGKWSWVHRIVSSISQSTQTISVKTIFWKNAVKTVLLLNITMIKQ